MNPEYQHYKNAAWFDAAKADRAFPAVNNLGEWRIAVKEIHGWPEYEAQPLHSLDNLASQVGVKKIYYKDESQRFGRGMGSFKALGAPYAVFCILADAVEKATGQRPTSDDLRSGKFRSITERVTVTVATDGNQGRGLAYAAKHFGCRCVVYIHEHVSPGRKEAMEALGAIVIRIQGEYEASVGRSRGDAKNNGWHFVSSTSWDNYASGSPRDVMNAYMVLVDEALNQLPDPKAVTHIFVQGGVGSIAAAIFLRFHQSLGGSNPRMIMVEPNEADCLYQSAFNKAPTPSAGSLHTIMAGLACREVSPAAWAILDWISSDFVTIPDSWAEHAMRVLAAGNGDTPVVCGETAAGGTAVVLKSKEIPALRESLGLDENSQVLLFGLEGATDPSIYERIVGRPASEIFESSVN
ncbi:diaminopropionate ammonia-lyase [Paraburkholderia sp. Ac-20342]|uniref:diaminopropionate ammonia-lyase n=1 Tax=Paraburkholderia sp. Ac-20342 TaxID=2703889 RepID=UPI00197D58D1|nr:diaminopropionate ammonia-lyase [Paraburkholderia sp. Ac-20342]MBN3846135.1 diaminopropionate ammonia-lyase [Paraburkholderia sp. Ac-20342]